jgi:regulator of replication initiation timing
MAMARRRLMAKKPFKQGTLLADLQEALETTAEPDQIESLLSQVGGLFARIETRRQKTVRQAEHINRIELSRKDLKERLEELGVTKRSAKAKNARQRMLRMLRAIDEHRVADYVVLRTEVERVIGYPKWLEAARQHEAEAAAQQERGEA